MSETSLRSIATNCVVGLRAACVTEINPSELEESLDRNILERYAESGSPEKPVYARISTIEIDSQVKISGRAASLGSRDALMLAMDQFLGPMGQEVVVPLFVADGSKYGLFELNGKQEGTIVCLSIMTDSTTGKSRIAVVSNNRELLQNLPIDQMIEHLKRAQEPSPGAQAQEIEGHGSEKSSVEANALALITNFKAAKIVKVNKTDLVGEALDDLGELFQGSVKDKDIFVLSPNVGFDTDEEVLDVWSLISEFLPPKSVAKIKAMVDLDFSARHLLGDKDALKIDTVKIKRSGPTQHILLLLSSEEAALKEIPWNKVEAKFREQYPEAGPRSPWVRGGESKN